MQEHMKPAEGTLNQGQPSKLNQIITPNQLNTDIQCYIDWVWGGVNHTRWHLHEVMCLSQTHSVMGMELIHIPKYQLVMHFQVSNGF